MAVPLTAAILQEKVVSVLLSEVQREGIFVADPLVAGHLCGRELCLGRYLQSSCGRVVLAFLLFTVHLQSFGRMESLCLRDLFVVILWEGVVASLPLFPLVLRERVVVTVS